MPLEDDVKEWNVSQKSELEGVANQIFMDNDSGSELPAIDMRTNLESEEIGLCLVNDLVFKELGLKELSPTRQFKRLASSRRGWKTEAFVRTAQGTNDMRSGGSFGDKIGRLFGGGRE
jgi:hypothetical protein